MTTVEDIEKAVEQLPAEQLARFLAWFEEFEATRFDARFERGSKAGKLDQLARLIAAHAKVSRAPFVRDFGAIGRQYRDAGFADVEVRPDLVLDRARAVVDAEVRVRRGPLRSFDRVVVTGNARVTTEAIRKEIGIAYGQRFSETAIEEAKRRLVALGVFRRVDVSTARGQDAAHLTLTVEVEE